MNVWIVIVYIAIGINSEREAKVITGDREVYRSLKTCEIMRDIRHRMFVDDGTGAPPPKVECVLLRVVR